MDGLDALVRRVDGDRWLASRFAPSALVRAKLIALYAVNYELAHVGESVREPGLGLIRLQWWREALARTGGESHPALDALRAAGAGAAAPVLSAIAEARAADLEAAPFKTWGEVEAYVDATAGALLGAALRLCGVSGAGERFARLGGRAWGFAGLLRAAPYWRARGRSPTPAGGVDDLGLRDRALSAYEAAKPLAPALPGEAFGAFGYLALMPDFLKGRSPALLERQVKLIIAAARGRI